VTVVVVAAAVTENVGIDEKLLIDNENLISWCMIRFVIGKFYLLP
jgi:hypothetical protein